MQISQKRYGDVRVLALAGRIDNGSSEVFKTGLGAHVAESRAAGDCLVLDFSGVDYISSVGLRALMLAARQSREQGGTIMVAALQPIVREIFEISRFNLVFECFGSVRQALEKVSPAGLAVYDAGQAR
ncbi:MAG: STAS domain-containing protein [Burkholderiales bacterium]